MASASTRRKTRQLLSKIPGFRTISRKICPPGQVLRKSYTRHYTSAVRRKGFTVKRNSGKTYRVYPNDKNMHVESRCVKDTAPNKTSKAGIFGPLRKGELAMYGYSFRAPESQRHTALRKAVDHYSPLGVYRKLDAVAKLTVRTAPSAAKTFARDREWVRATFGPLKAQ